MSVIAVIQARMGSSRFPNKVLVDLDGKPMLEVLTARILKSKKIDGLVVATSTHSGDDAIASFCSSRGIPVFRGSELDVLDRFYKAASFLLGEDASSEALVLRLTGDCPLYDPELLDRGIEYFASKRGELDYLGYGPQMPEGFDFEIMLYSGLIEIAAKAESSFAREHVTPYFRESGAYACEYFVEEIAHRGLRLSVDYPEDTLVTKAILAEEKRCGRLLQVAEICNFVGADPKLYAVSAQHIANEGALLSYLQSDLGKQSGGDSVRSRFAVDLRFVTNDQELNAEIEMLLGFGFNLFYANQSLPQDMKASQLSGKEIFWLSDKEAQQFVSVEWNDQTALASAILDKNLYLLTKVDSVQNGVRTMIEALLQKG